MVFPNRPSHSRPSAIHEGRGFPARKERFVFFMTPKISRHLIFSVARLSSANMAATSQKRTVTCVSLHPFF